MHPCRSSVCTGTTCQLAGAGHLRRCCEHRLNSCSLAAGKHKAVGGQQTDSGAHLLPALLRKVSASVALLIHTCAPALQRCRVSLLVDVRYKLAGRHTRTTNSFLHPPPFMYLQKPHASSSSSSLASLPPELPLSAGGSLPAGSTSLLSLHRWTRAKLSACCPTLLRLGVLLGLLCWWWLLVLSLRSCTRACVSVQAARWHMQAEISQAVLPIRTVALPSRVLSRYRSGQTGSAVSALQRKRMRQQGGTGWPLCAGSGLDCKPSSSSTARSMQN